MTEIEKILSCVGKPVRYTYPGEEGQKRGILKDRSVTTGGLVGVVPYWDVVDLIEFEGEPERMIRISYYRKPKERLNFAGQTSITEPLSIWKKLLITAAQDKPWFREILDDVMNELRHSEETSPGIENRPDVMGGVACIKRTRIPVWLLEQARRLGISDADLLRDYPTLTAQDLTNAWNFVRSHRAEIDAQIKANES